MKGSLNFFHSRNIVWMCIIGFGGFYATTTQCVPYGAENAPDSVN